jgi:hypothetical protein
MLLPHGYDGKSSSFLFYCAPCINLINGDLLHFTPSLIQVEELSILLAELRDSFKVVMMILIHFLL